MTGPDIVSKYTTCGCATVSYTHLDVYKRQVYWSVTNKRLPAESTTGLAASGTAINRQDLQPGDIIVRLGGESGHVVMFLAWTENDSMICIHESSAAVGNVAVSVMDANWKYYRKLVE